jgi:hypothetical protein
MVTAKARSARSVYATRPWRIHDIAPDFDVLDVWELPTPGGRDDFPRLLDVMNSLDVERSSPVVHALFAARWALGRLFDLDEPDDEIRSQASSLRNPPADGWFTPLYVADHEAALEIVNRTVHGVLHLGWVPTGTGGHRGEMTILVKPNGMLGRAYLAAIAPFRRLIVYPTILRALGRAWRDQVPAVTVSQVDTPRDVRDVSTLPRVDYADTFVVEADAAPDWTAEEWARAVLEGASAEMRARLLSGWTALGLRSVAAAGSILGWEIRHRSPDTVLLGRDSRIGMPGELLFMRRPEGLLFATFVHHRTPATRPVWVAVKPMHVNTVRTLLQRASAVRESAQAG